MSNLSLTNILTIEKFINKKTSKKGFIWDFSDAKFKEFVKSYTGLNIFEDKYLYEDGTSSKMKRLKTFLKVEEDIYVIMLLNGLKEYGKKNKYLYKTNIEEIEKYIKKLNKTSKEIVFDKNIFKSEKKVNILIQDINEKVAKKQYELAIDRVHTLFKGYIENVCDKLGIEIEGKSLDALYGEILKYIHQTQIFSEGVTQDILSSSKKIMKSFDYARNNKSFAHTNDIMEENEAEFLCVYIIDLYKFLNKISWKKQKGM